MFATDWLPVLVEVAAISLGLFFYILHWSVRGRLRRIRCAKMLLAELNMTNRRVALHSDQAGSDSESVENPIEPLPHNAYDGLVSSASISYLSQSLQEQLHSFYRLVAVHNYNVAADIEMRHDSLALARPITPERQQLTKAVKEFLRKNEHDRRWVLKMFRAYDGDD